MDALDILLGIVIGMVTLRLLQLATAKAATSGLLEGERYLHATPPDPNQHPPVLRRDELIRSIGKPDVIEAINRQDTTEG